MTRFPRYSNPHQIHCELNCEFRKIPLKISNENKTISMRMSGEMLDKINEKIDEISILTKRDISLSDYLRGLIKKDLD
jgi:2-hydroxy-3-keto-5-methylthiopentenyl-1-phosphate phosphatase